MVVSREGPALFGCCTTSWPQRTFPACQRKCVFRYFCDDLHICISSDLANVIIPHSFQFFFNSLCITKSYRKQHQSSLFFPPIQRHLWQNSKPTLFSIRNYLEVTLMLPLRCFCFQDNSPVCELFEFSVLFAKPRCFLLEVMLTRERWLWFDNGVQVSLGNRRDLTQDAELPLGFFYAPSPSRPPWIPAFLPSQHPLTKGKDGSSVPVESEIKS